MPIPSLLLLQLSDATVLLLVVVAIPLIALQGAVLRRWTKFLMSPLSERSAQKTKPPAPSAFDTLRSANAEPVAVPIPPTPPTKETP